MPTRSVTPPRPEYDLRLPGQTFPTPARSPVNHSPSIAALPEGGLVMAWFGGSREGARDVQIFLSSFDGEKWADARPVFSTDGLIDSTRRYLTKLGNPVLHHDGKKLHIWFVSVSLGGWGGARLNHAQSHDGGRSWTLPRVIVASPFLNVSTLVRSPALNTAASRGAGPAEILLPAYFELSHKYPLLLRFGADGTLLDRQAFGDMTGLLQPSVIRPNPAEPAHLQAYFRRGQAVPTAQIHTSFSVDGGAHWSEAQPLGIPNGDASVVAWPDAPLQWIVANPNPANRHSIAAYAVTPADLAPGAAGALLTPVRMLDDVRGEGAATAEPSVPPEFSYPSFARTTDGRLHLVYSADGRRSIRHRAWHRLPGQVPATPGETRP